jgi:hypothetical protein
VTPEVWRSRVALRDASLKLITALLVSAIFTGMCAQHTFTQVNNVLSFFGLFCGAGVTLVIATQLAECIRKLTRAA